MMVEQAWNITDEENKIDEDFIVKITAWHLTFCTN